MKNAGSDSVGLEQELRFCISDKLPWTTLSCARDNSNVSPRI